MIYGKRTITDSDEGFTRIPDGKRKGTPPPYQPGDELKPISDLERMALTDAMRQDVLEGLFGTSALVPETLSEMVDMVFDTNGTRYDVNTDTLIGKIQRLDIPGREELIHHIRAAWQEQ